MEEKTEDRAWRNERRGRENRSCYVTASITALVTASVTPFYLEVINIDIFIWQIFS